MKRVELNTKTLKYRHDNKKCEIMEINTKAVSAALNTQVLKKV